MKKNKRSRFIVRWFVCSFGLWIAAQILGDSSISYGGKVSAVIVSGLILAIANTIIKPLVVFLTLPAVLLSLGIFMVVINALMVLLAARLYGPLEVAGFGVAVVAGIIIGLVNWLVSALLEE
ncbi:MAG TPA: phage holin family protein [Candidatus Saccharibacteria bacterium]|jgi:putative membrane protein|nr:phage holin family protein [Candidatus Saccharibacteria bacterium]HMT55892.1 phage holin family protein [Candidatus Saccharibacteria bacterium]